MPPPVRVLDSALADQIAAGEVVERPASVVKELLENAIDAGATAITVETLAGGTSLVRVTDDGHGMPREDAVLAVRRHATSKIRNRDDLEAIATLGFRGEALPSIASVSRFRLRTRTRDEVEGTEVSIEGGAAAAVSPIGCAVGSVVEVRDLFFNVPARLKFLKAQPTENAHISEACMRAALSTASLKLVLLREGKPVREYLPAADWAARAAQVLGDGKLVRVEAERDGVRVRALLGAPEDARVGATGLHLYVNGRAVRERALARSVAFAYGSVLPPGRFPVGVLHLDIDPREVDVNVHPQKAEVRFRDARGVLDSVTNLVAKALGTSAWKGPASRGAGFWAERLPMGPAAEPGASARPSMAADPWGLASAGANTSTNTSTNTGTSTSTNTSTRTTTSDGVVGYGLMGAGGSVGVGQALLPERPQFRAVAQVRRMYIVAEAESGLFVFDQHACDERIKFDALRTQSKNRTLAVQRLLMPERFEVTSADAAAIEERAEAFAAAGCELTLLGPTTAAVHSVPALVRRANPVQLARALLTELARTGNRDFGDALDTALATMACHGSIRAGDVLSLPECQALLDALGRISEFAGHCPHGRPVALDIAFSELERKVGR